MRVDLVTWLPGILTLGIGGCNAGGSTKLTDDAATAVMQTELKGHMDLFSLGEVHFRTRPPYGIGLEMSTRYPMYRSLADRGLLQLDGERDLTAKFSGWDDFLSLTQSGVQRLAKVVLTPAGAKLGTGDSQYVSFVFGRYRFERVVSNEPLEVNGEKYRVVMGTHVFELKPEFRGMSFVGENLAGMPTSGLPNYREGRFRALLKYDVFASKWKLQVMDDGPRDVEFQSQQVPSALAALRPLGPR